MVLLYDQCGCSSTPVLMQLTALPLLFCFNVVNCPSTLVLFQISMQLIALPCKAKGLIYALPLQRMLLVYTAHRRGFFILHSYHLCPTLYLHQQDLRMSLFPFVCISSVCIFGCTCFRIAFCLNITGFILNIEGSDEIASPALDQNLKWSKNPICHFRFVLQMSVTDL